MIKGIWTKLSTIGVDGNLSAVGARKAILTNQLAYITFSVVFIMNSSFIFIDTIAFDPIGLIMSFVILSTPILNKFGYHKTAAFIFATLMPISLAMFSSVNKTLMPPPIPFETYVFPKIYLLSFLVLPLIILDSRSKWVLFLALFINLSCIFWIDHMNEFLGVGLDFANVSFESYNRLNYLVLFPIAIVVFGFLFLNSINNKSEDQILQQNKKLENANKKIEIINSNFTDSIEYAKRIQQALLPEKGMLKTFFADSFVYYKPKNIVSGDFYFFKEIKINDVECFAIVCGDCTGHGVPGGFMSVLSISILNEIIRVNNFTDAANILDQLRQNIKVALNQTGKHDEPQDGLEMSLIIYHPDKKEIEFSGAENPIYLINQHDQLEIFRGDKMPIGIHPHEEAFTNMVVDVSNSKMCYMFTDGIVDQMNKNGIKLTSNNLREWLLEFHSQNCQNQHNSFSEKMKQWMQNNSRSKVDQIDDMLLIGIKF